MASDSQSWCFSESNISRSGRSWRQVEAEHRYTVGTLQLGFARDFSYEFSWGYVRSIVKYLRKVLPEGEVPQNSFEHFPNARKVFMVAPKIMIFIENLCFSLDFRARTL